MKGLNPELTAKIATEVAIKKLVDNAKDLIERRRPTTRAAISQIKDDLKLEALVENGDRAYFESLEFNHE